MPPGTEYQSAPLVIPFWKSLNHGNQGRSLPRISLPDRRLVPFCSFSYAPLNKNWPSIGKSSHQVILDRKLNSFVPLSTLITLIVTHFLAVARSVIRIISHQIPSVQICGEHELVSQDPVHDSFGFGLTLFGFSSAFGKSTFENRENLIKTLLLIFLSRI